jgi:polyisoprenoid-binding protein YceI
VIRAASGALTGVLDPAARSFAFAVDVESFAGFNSELQRDHFREKYMEAGRFPQAAFTGRIIEDTDFTQPGSYTVRAKGMLTVHGIATERIIRASIVSKGSTLQVSASFTVPLAEHQIAIPKLVTEKVAEEIQVSVSAAFRR